MAEPRVHRFRPRYRVIPWIVAAVGVFMLVYGFFGGLAGASKTFAIVSGILGPLIALAYLRSSTWKLAIVVDDDALVVKKDTEEKFRLRWVDVKEVVYSKQYPTLFIDGGAPERSILVPGPGVPAQYRVEDNEALCAFVRAHVDEARQRAVD